MKSLYKNFHNFTRSIYFLIDFTIYYTIHNLRKRKNSFCSSSPTPSIPNWTSPTQTPRGPHRTHSASLGPQPKNRPSPASIRPLSILIVAPAAVMAHGSPATRAQTTRLAPTHSRTHRATIYGTI
jgi:hypothetical protein